MCCEEVIGREPSLGAFAGSPCAHLALDAEPRASRLARAFIREAVDDDDEDLLDEVALLTSELVTNAVIHARTPVEIGVVHDGERVLVAVSLRAFGLSVSAKADDRLDRAERSWHSQCNRNAS